MDIITKTDPGVTPGEARMAKQALAALHTSYPGHQWGTDMQGAFMIIRNKRLTGKYGYRINLLVTSDIQAEARRAGGEILERYRQPRGAMNNDRLQAKVFEPDD